MFRRAIIVAFILLSAGCNLFTSLSPGGGSDAAKDAGTDVAEPTDARDASDPIDAADDVRIDGGDTGGCTPESPVEFCARQGKNCGVLTGVDNCGADRSIDCGECADAPCGESEPNVCGCPCLIGDECWIPGEVNPEDPCQVCDPDQATDAFSIAEGIACDDGNPCSAESFCTADGTCMAEDFDGCDSESTDCAVGSCDQDAMSCVVDPLPDDTECTDDGLACTTDRCSDGECSHDLIADTCLVEDACYADGEADPDNPCMECDVATSTDSFTAVAAGTSCPDGDGLSCTQGECDANGACMAVLQPGNCQIGSSCYADGDSDPANPCMYCDPATSRTSFTAQPNGSSCPDGDGLSCTSGECDGGTCDAELQDGNCLIDDDSCFADGAANPANACEVCDPSTDEEDWTPAPGGTSCPTSLACTSGSCDAGNCVESIDFGSCVINNVCYDAGEPDPASMCQYCDPTVSNTSWSSIPDDTPCGTGSCTCQTGMCLKTNMTPCN